MDNQYLEEVVLFCQVLFCVLFLLEQVKGLVYNRKQKQQKTFSFTKTRLEQTASETCLMENMCWQFSLIKDSKGKGMRYCHREQKRITARSFYKQSSGAQGNYTRLSITSVHRNVELEGDWLLRWNRYRLWKKFINLPEKASFMQHKCIVFINLWKLSSCSWILSFASYRTSVVEISKVYFNTARHLDVVLEKTRGGLSL